MPKQKTDDLLRLIESLTRAEKRHFRLFVRRNQQVNSEILFLQLFDQLERSGEYDEEFLLRKIEGIKKSQLSNLKAHLYKQLLISLRLLNRNRDEEIQLREQIDYARILYNKGLYNQALDILDKVKKKALNFEFLVVALEIAQFEKLIEGQHITRSIEGRAEELSRECGLLAKQIALTDRFSNLAMQLYGYYLKRGLASGEEDLYFVQSLFESLLPDTPYEQLTFWGKIYYCQAYHWYHHIRQEFALCHRYNQRWVDLFQESPQMVSLKPDLYLKGLHNHLTNLFNMWQHDRYKAALELLIKFPEDYPGISDFNTEGLYQLHRFTHLIMLHFLEGRFTDGLKLVPELTEIIDSSRYNWDDHRNMLFYYRIACLYFGSGDNDTAIDYLNRIINQRSPDYRSDIQAYARILSLICHFEMGNIQLVEYQVKSVYRFLSKVEHLQETLQVIFKFLRRLPRIREDQLHDAFVQLKERYDEVASKPFEQRPIIYLDISSWLQSKIEGVAVEEVLRKRFLANQKAEA